jgi:CheY-like chemotaxis protein
MLVVSHLVLNRHWVGTDLAKSLPAINGQPVMLNAESTMSLDDASPAPDGGGTVTPPLRLWLVDDNDRLRNTVAELLSRVRGIECARSFSSATAALSALASKVGPDVILLDIQMGNENGLDAVRPIKSLSRNTRVFMFTTLADEYARVRARENGASGFLLKRCNIDEIVAAIRKPGEFDGLPRRRRSVASELTPAPCPSDKRPQTSARIETKPDVFKRCLGVLRSFWN